MSVRPPAVSRASRIAAAVLVGLGGLAGCHASSARRELPASGGSGVALPVADVLAAPFELEPVRPTLVAMPRPTYPVRPTPPPTAFECSWAEAPVAPSSTYDVNVGVGVGLAFPGDQDLKFKRKNASGDLIDNLSSGDVDEHPALVESLDVEVWKSRGFLRDFGLRASLIHWSTRVEARSFEDHLPGGTSPVPPFDTLDEERLGVYVSLTRRLWLACRDATGRDPPYVYLGIGAGYVCSDLTHGATNWDTSAQAYVGFSVPLADRWRLRIEGLYLATRDVDIEGANLDWEAESSGSPTGLPHSKNFSHLDTRFFVAMLGVEYRL